MTIRRDSRGRFRRSPRHFWGNVVTILLVILATGLAYTAGYLSHPMLMYP